MGIFDKLIGGGKRREFGEKLISILQRVPEVQASSFNEAAFELRLRDSIGSYNVPLEEVFVELQNHPDDEFEDSCLSLIIQMIRFTDGVPDKFEHAKDRLFPQVRERVYYDLRALHELIETGHEPFLPRAELAESIGIDLVWQSDDALYPVEGHHYQNWGVDFADAMSIAVHNMQKYRTKRWTSPQPRVYVSPWRSPYDASMILFDEWISDLRVIGDPVIMLPTCETMIVTGSSDLAGMTAMAELVEDIVADGTRFLTLVPFTLKDKEIVPFIIPEGHNLAHRFRLMELETQMRDYTAQKEILDEWFAVNGRPTLVADYTGMENQNTRELHSYCVWPSQSKPVLLPKTDRIYFVDDVSTGRVCRTLPWEAVTQTLEGAFEELDMWPIRYKVEGYPSDEQFRDCINNS